MKINLEELKKLSQQVKIKMSDEELEQIGSSIADITNRLDELLKEDITDVIETRTSAEKPYNFEQSDEGENLSVDVLNNNEGDFIVLTKEGENNDN